MHSTTPAGIRTSLSGVLHITALAATGSSVTGHTDCSYYGLMNKPVFPLLWFRVNLSVDHQ